MTTKNRKAPQTEYEAKDEIKIIAKSILIEAKKRAKYEMDCLTDLVLQEARIIARYARKKPFYIS